MTDIGQLRDHLQTLIATMPTDEAVERFRRRRIRYHWIACVVFALIGTAAYVMRIDYADTWPTVVQLLLSVTVGFGLSSAGVHSAKAAILRHGAS